MGLETKVTDKTLTVLLDDEFTIHTANLFRDLLAEQLKSITHIIINLSKVTEMDTAGFQLLVAIKNLSSKYEVEFVEHSAAVIDVLELYGLSGDFGDSVIVLGESVS